MEVQTSQGELPRHNLDYQGRRNKLRSLQIVHVSRAERIVKVIDVFNDHGDVEVTLLST